MIHLIRKQLNTIYYALFACKYITSQWVFNPASISSVTLVYSKPFLLAMINGAHFVESSIHQKISKLKNSYGRSSNQLTNRMFKKGRKWWRDWRKKEYWSNWTSATPLKNYKQQRKTNTNGSSMSFQFKVNNLCTSWQI